MKDVTAGAAETIHAECCLTLLNTSNEAIVATGFDQILAIVALYSVYDFLEAIFELETCDL